MFVDGAAVYQRLGALPRVRWAAKSRVIADTKARLAVLAGDASDDDTAILGAPAAGADGAPAKVDVVTDTGDRIRAHVSAQGAGYLVVADAPMRGLQARVDGKKSTLVVADDALVAVPVPKGDHTVTLDYRAPRARLGALVSLVAAVVLLVCAGFAVRQRRRSRGVLPAATGDS